MEECEFLKTCVFFQKYNDSKDLVLFLVEIYCKGRKMDDCFRKKYRREHGQAPPENMMPNGYMIIS